MKVPMSRVQAGITKYLDNEMMPQIKQTRSNLSTFGISLFAALAIQNLPATMEKLTQSPAIEWLGVIDNEGVEIDALAEQARQVMPAEGLKVALPVVGTITFRREDIDSLAQYIKD